MATETALVDVGLLFAAVAIAGILANRINQSVIPLYIVTGVVLGSNVLGELSGLTGSHRTVGGISIVVPELTVAGTFCQLPRKIATSCVANRSLGLYKVKNRHDSG